MNNREQIGQSVISASAYNGNDTEGLLKEIEDVYKKTQAFDEILEGMTNAIQHSVKEGVELDEAWHRLKYYVVVNHLGHLVSTIGKATRDEVVL
ncbi:DUF1024 family protein [Staphylococcus aureus]|uniref:DUF1024 family protein n=1 Tax=Staphylococcus aureus TaxID=1280 RepID=UPI00210CCC56|nr:DUF1024 family protein [Staphylococcus aureus]